MIKQACIILIVFATLFIVWEFASLTFADLMFILPAPSKIFLRIWETPDRFYFHTTTTVKEMTGGFALAFAVGFPLAGVMLYSKSARLVFQPLFVVIQCVPMFTLAPIMVMWFDWSYTAVLIPTALMIFFPMTINIYKGLRSTPQPLLDYFAINNSTAWQRFLKLQLPWAIPHICVGFRISVAIAGIGAVAGEWAGAQEGLGILMLESRRNADIATTFAALFCLTAVSLVFYTATTLLERAVAERRNWRFLYPSLNRRTAIACSIVLCILPLSCCQKSEKSTQTRLMLDWLPNPNHIPLYVGIEKGFFSDRGIDIKIYKNPDSSSSVSYLASGQTELALSYMPHVLRSVSVGADLKVIGVIIAEPLNCLIFRKGENIRHPKHLSGKILGYCSAWNSSGFLDAILSDHNIEPKQKRNVNFDLVSTLGSRSVDVVYGAYWNIETEQLKSLGIPADYFTFAELDLPNYHELVVIAKNHSKEAEHNFVALFQDGLQESINFCRKNPEESMALYLKNNPDKSKSTISWEKAAWHKTIPALAKTQKIDKEIWQNLYLWLLAHRLIETPYDVHLLYE